MPPCFADPGALESERLRVRLVEAVDLTDLLRVNGNDEVTRYLPYATWIALADAQAWLERMQQAQASGTTLQWVVVDKASGTVVGTCLLFQYDELSSRAELGYVLGHDWWGQGLMHEALQALLQCAFTTLGLRRIEAEVDPRNLASGKLLQKLGFSSEGVLRGRWVTKGHVCDVESFGLLRDDRDQAAGVAKCIT
jgi:ribosomal-protein-alanine N-acetyltransferase